MEDLYKKMQVDPLAETEVIRAAYHALARKYHPDAGGDPKRMVEINRAWSVLGDPRTRSAYDTERAKPPQPPVSAAASAQQPHSDAPPRNKLDSSSVLDFGRYAGWSIQQLVSVDPDYLEWLVRTPIGRRLAAEARDLVTARTASRGPAGTMPPGGRPVGPLPAQKGRGLAGRLRFGRA